MADNGFAFYIDVDGSVVRSLLAPGVFIVKEAYPGEPEEAALARVRLGQGTRISVGQLKNVIALPTGRPLIGLTATAQSSSVIRLEWDRFPLAFSYEVQRSTDNITFAPWRVVSSTLTGKPTVDHTGLSQSTIYYYQVRAKNALGVAISLWTKTSTTTLIGLEAVQGTTTTTLIPALLGIGYNATVGLDVLNLLLNYSEPVEAQVSRNGDVIPGTILAGNAGKFNLVGDTWQGYSGRIRLDRAIVGQAGIQAGDIITIKVRTVANRLINFVYTWTVQDVENTDAIALPLSGTDSGTVRLQVFAQGSWKRTVASPPSSVPALPTNKMLTYTLMNPDGPGFPDANGAYLWDNYGTAVVQNGSETHPAYINDWPGQAYAIVIAADHYMANRTTMRRHVVYEKQRAAIRAAGKKYYLRIHFARGTLNDTIITSGNVSRDNLGNPAYQNGGYVPTMLALKQYVAGGSVDTENAWHHHKAYLTQLVNDFKADILDGTCISITATLCARLEDGYSNRNQEAGDPTPGNLLLGDYNAEVIADFKSVMGVSQDPPQPGNYLYKDAFQGAVGKKWYIYRQEAYIAFKAWVKGVVQEIVPGTNMGTDYGQVGWGGAAAGYATLNPKRVSAGCGIVKQNPVYADSAEFFTDYMRTIAPSGARVEFEADQDWVLNHSAAEVADLIGRYFSRGAAGIYFSQMGNQNAFTLAKAVANLCLSRGYTGPVTSIARPDSAHRVSYTTDEILTGPDHVPQARWYDAGGSNTSVEVDINDTFTY